MAVNPVTVARPEDLIEVTEKFLRFLRRQNLGHLARQYEDQIAERVSNKKHRVRFVSAVGSEVT